MSLRRVLWTLLVIALVVGAAIGLAGIGAYYASQQTPDFYQRALNLPPTEQQEAGDQLELQLLQLHNETRREGRWQAVFTSQQINGWLAADLPEKFPGLLPQGASDPRVAISQDCLQLACRYQRQDLSVVVSLDIEAHLTDQPNVVAIVLRGARAGLLPLPQKKILERLETAARQANLTLRWGSSGDDPVALVTIPSEHEEFDRVVSLEAVALRDDSLLVEGRTGGGSAAAKPLQTALQPGANQASQR